MVLRRRASRARAPLLLLVLTTATTFTTLTTDTTLTTILSETKTTENQCWNAQETHRPHDLSIGKDNICSVRRKNLPQHIPPVFLRCQF